MSTIPLSKLVCGKNVRFTGVEDFIKSPLESFSEDYKTKVVELSKSIAAHGLLNPITVKDLGGGNKFRVIAGYTRLKAVQLLGKNAIDVKPIKGEEEDEIIVGLVENVHRSDLSPIDVARSLKDIMEIKKIEKQSTLADLVGKSAAWVSQHITLLESDPSVQKEIEDGNLGLAGARAIAALPVGEQADAVAAAKEETSKEKPGKGKKNKKGKISTKAAKDQSDKRQPNKRPGKKVDDDGSPKKSLVEREAEQCEEMVSGFIKAKFPEDTVPENMASYCKMFWDFLFENDRIYVR